MASRNTKAPAKKPAASKQEPKPEVPAVEPEPVAPEAPVEPELEDKPAEDPKDIPSAPLDPPAEPPAPQEPTVHQPASSGELGGALVARSPQGSRLLDNATKEPPNPDGLFEKIPGPGSQWRCTVRLVQETFLGHHHTPVTRLVMTQHQIVSADVAARITDALTEQLAAEEAETA